MGGVAGRADGARRAVRRQRGAAIFWVAAWGCDGFVFSFLFFSFFIVSFYRIVCFGRGCEEVAKGLSKVEKQMQSECKQLCLLKLNTYYFITEKKIIFYYIILIINS